MRLPVYDASNVQVSDGSGTFRPASGASPIGEGLSKLGSTLQQVGLSLAQDDLKLQGAIAAEAKRAGALEDYKEQQQFTQGWLVRQNQIEDGISETGKDHAANALKEFDAYAADQIKGNPKWANKIEGLRTQVLSKNLEFEQRQRGKFIQKVHGDTLQEFGASAIAGGPEATGTLVGELTERVKSLQLGNEALEQTFIKEGTRAIQQGALTWATANKPKELLESAKGLAADMPRATADKRTSDYIQASKNAGLGPHLLVAIGHLESGMNASVVPRRRDGVLMSSAQGEMQILDGAYGITNKLDPVEVGQKLGQHLSQAKERMERSGIIVTPGKLYAIHNLGDGAALALMRNPNASVNDVMAQVYGNRSFRDKNSGEVRLWREAVVQNNPSLYGNGNLSAGEAIQKLEAKMAEGMKKASAHTGGVEGEFTSSKEVIQQRLKALGVESSELTPKDYLDAVQGAQKNLAKSEKENFEFDAGKRLTTGETRLDPNDSTQKKLVDKFVTQSTDMADRVLKGDANALQEARALTARINYLPKSVASSIEQLVMSQGGDSEAKVRAFETLRSIQNENPTAWGASDITKEARERVDQYVAAVDIQGKSAHEALKQVQLSNSPDGIKRREAMKGFFAGDDGKREVADITLGVVAGRFKDGTWFAPNVDEKSAEGRTLLGEFHEAYKAYRTNGEEPSDAMDRAASDLKSRYGTTDLFGSRLMRHPPEKNFPQVEGSHKWIEKQGQEAMQVEFLRRGLSKEANKAKGLGVDIQMALVADPQTEQEKRTGKPLSYLVMFRNPRTGQGDMLYERFTPDFKRADDESRETLRKRGPQKQITIGDLIVP
jgi:hypothetical protein